MGVHCDCSGDLHNWDDQGIALLVSQAPNSEISKGCILERPKVIYNSKTKKFVMWFHLEHKGKKYNTAHSAVAVANSPTGPFTFLHSLRPNAGHWPINASEEIKHVPAKSELEGIKFTGDAQLNTVQHNILGRDFNQGQMARDMTLFVDDDEKAYHIYSSENNSTLHISQLTDDYLAPSGTYSRVFPNRWMEASAICKHQGKYYLLSERL
ncbi:MAG: hypothetical protein JKX85_08635 [Phycisphaeraceae bacterium]|nr:hypothetical protein [Phycisphaeraceae bacterium]